jgi:predicted transcriptional regulator
MVKHTNFEDNIFLLSIRLRMLRDMLLLDADPELFLEMTLDDIDFIDRTLTILLKNLMENKRLIERDEQLYNLSNTEHQFVEILSGFSTGTGTISGVKFPLINEKIGALQKQSLSRQKTIADSITEFNKDSDNTVVSSDELMELLKDF